MTLEKGSIINQYKIISAIGKGGMGEVYLAEDERLRRKVALKVLPDTLAQDSDRLRRFEQEALAASALNHPNILTIYEFGAAGATHFLAAEFIDGETLRARLQRMPLAINEALDITIQVAQALSAAHEAHIIHRDIKSENVMLRKDGIVKVLDFGLAKLVEPAPLDAEAETRKLGLTQAGTVMGTVAYMSPEQARGNTVDARTDLFSLGVMLYELLARRQPFTGETINHVIVAILEKEPPPLEQHVPVELTRILKQALAKNADERYPKAQAILTDLKKLQKRLEYEAEFERPSSPNASAEAQTLMLQQTTAAAPEAMATVAGGAQPTRPDKPKAQKWWLAGLLSLVALVGAVFGYRYYTPGSGQIDSLAVLPFQNRSGNADSEYLADGLAESLIYRLSQLPNLKVSPTSSVFRYKGKDTDPVKIGSELGVQAVMTGRIAQRGESLVISVELVDVRNNKTLWGEQYDRRLSDLLAIQREMASEITQRLQLKLSGEGEQKLAKRYTDNPEAYQLYLKGQYHFSRRTEQDHQKSIEFFRQAVKLDPSFALAYAGIAESYATMPLYPYLSPKEAVPQAKVAVAKALELDPELAEAHTIAGYIASGYDWNWAEAEREFKRAIELDPKLANAHYRYAWTYLTPLGRHEEAIAEMKRALELEPLNLIQGAHFAAVLMYARQFDAALEQARKTSDLDPNFVIGKSWLCFTLNAKGRYAESLAISEKTLQRDSLLFPQASYAYAKMGRRQQAEEVINRWREIEKSSYVLNYWIASVYGALGEKEAAFAELEKTYQARDFFFHRLKVDPIMDPLRDDPRFNALLQRLNLPE
jgi:serine/threonine protein kinase/Tfp pilus assembly protein PilF